MPRKPSATLTDVEAEVMAVLWRLQRGSVGEVVAAMQETRPVNKYLPPRARRPLSDSAPLKAEAATEGGAASFFAWLDGMLDRI